MKIYVAVIILLLAAGLAVAKPRSRNKEAKPDAKLDPNSKVTVTVVLPDAEAEVWIDSNSTKQKGLERTFVTPPLEPGNYVYLVRASWVENKETRVTTERTLKFRPGATIRVDFTKAEPKGKNLLPGTGRAR
jgi:uncharacterized protein (TIGR03000 family)